MRSPWFALELTGTKAVQLYIPEVYYLTRYDKVHLNQGLLCSVSVLKSWQMKLQPEKGYCSV